jgi:hypothetical protein
MALKIDDSNPGFLTIELSGKLTADDYEAFVPKVDAIVQENGSIRILMKMHDFHGWEMGAMWEDIKFATKHCRDVERIAMVGDKSWEKWMAMICKPFTMSKIKYFDDGQQDEARQWLTEA